MATVLEKIWTSIKESLLNSSDSETKEKLIWIKNQIAQEYINKLKERNPLISDNEESILSYLSNEWTIEDVFKDVFREVRLSILTPSEVENLKKVKDKLSSINEIPTEDKLTLLKNEIVNDATNNINETVQNNAGDMPQQELKKNNEHISLEWEWKFIKNVINRATTQIWKKYTRWWTSPEWWFDCSGLWNWAFKQEWIKFKSRLTAATFSDADTDVQKDDVKIWDFMFWDQKPGSKKHSKIYHIEMVISKPYIKNGKTYVRTLWSSTDAKDDLGNHVWNWVRVREREMKAYRHYWRPKYYYQLAQHEKTGSNEILRA